ncbi:CxxxxCH/CxxCH domain c-type cytochrome [Haliangium sp.]|uniref:CxxxxCH/CxxCH domain c-type cytochrome n=1 Tax=Haliangium sp. TaxID=2663208 RepID=UPI003D144379
MASGCTFDGSGLGGTPLEENPPPAPPPPNADLQLGCSGTCHGDEDSTAPPLDIEGGTDTESIGVGAHRSHINPAPTFHRAVQCDDCHTVPAAVGDDGHLDGDDVAELTFGDVATANGTAASWDRDNTTCTVYCHGASLEDGGGSLTTPDWTRVDDTQNRCGTCHGAPPPEPHPSDTNCGTCHPTMKPGTLEFLDPASHINGELDVVDGALDAVCGSCHGEGDESSPPRDLAGNTERSAPGVGAHRQHVGDSDWHRDLSCVQCHVVPVQVDDPDHIDGDNIAEMTFDTLNPTASYDRDNVTCTNVYCHSDGGKEFETMVWTDDVTLDCDSCHDDRPRRRGRFGLSGEHRRHLDDGNDDITCGDCHADVISGDRDFVDPDLHINGVFDVTLRDGGSFDAAAKRCSNVACHQQLDEDIDDPSDW